MFAYIHIVSSISNLDKNFVVIIWFQVFISNTNNCSKHIFDTMNGPLQGLLTIYKCGPGSIVHSPLLQNCSLAAECCLESYPEYNVVFFRRKRDLSFCISYSQHIVSSVNKVTNKFIYSIKWTQAVCQWNVAHSLAFIFITFQLSHHSPSIKK